MHSIIVVASTKYPPHMKQVMNSFKSFTFIWRFKFSWCWSMLFMWRN